MNLKTFETTFFWILFPIAYLLIIPWLIRAKRLVTSKILLLVILGYLGISFIPFLLEGDFHKSFFVLLMAGSLISIFFYITLVLSLIFLLFRLKNTDIVSAVFFGISFFIFALAMIYYGKEGKFTWELGLELFVVFSYFGCALLYLSLCSSWEAKRKKEKELKKQFGKMSLRYKSK
jgi:hypothetical protein